MKYSKWEPEFRWYEINADAYKLILDQGKERFEDIMSESESITNKSIRMLIALAAFSGFLIDFFLKEPISLRLYLGAAVIFSAVIGDVFILYILISPKQIKNRGLAPKLTIDKDIDDTENKAFQVELTYYRSIVLTQQNIDDMINKNEKRAKLYKIALVLFLLIFIGASLAISQAINHL